MNFEGWITLKTYHFFVIVVTQHCTLTMQDHHGARFHPLFMEIHPRVPMFAPKSHAKTPLSGVRCNLVYLLT
jgi:hypothetical protein